MNESVAPRQESTTRRRRIRVGALVAVLAVIGFVVWLLVKGSDNGGSSSGRRALPVRATVSQLRDLPNAVGHDVYWAGAKAATRYELTQTRGGNIYIRYLPAGVQIGEQRPNYLTVGTYPFRNAYAALHKQAKAGAVSGGLPRNGIYVVSANRPNSVYMAYRGSNLQIEVFDPSSSVARRLVVSGKVRPIR